MSSKSSTAPPKIDLDRFLKKSNATLYRIEKTGLIILAVTALIAYFFYRQTGLSLLLGGCLGMFHFRALHRMSQRRIIVPKSRLNAQFFYSLKLFLMIALFFWVTGQGAVSTPLVIAGFFLTTASVLIDGKRR